MKRSPVTAAIVSPTTSRIVTKGGGADATAPLISPSGAAPGIILHARTHDSNQRRQCTARQGVQCNPVNGTRAGRGAANGAGRAGAITRHARTVRLWRRTVHRLN